MRRLAGAAAGRQSLPLWAGFGRHAGKNEVYDLSCGREPLAGLVEFGFPGISRIPKSHGLVGQRHQAFDQRRECEIDFREASPRSSRLCVFLKGTSCQVKSAFKAFSGTLLAVKKSAPQKGGDAARLRCVLGMFSSLEVQVLRPT